MGVIVLSYPVLPFRPASKASDCKTNRRGEQRREGSRRERREGGGWVKEKGREDERRKRGKDKARHEKCGRNLLTLVLIS